MECLCLHSKAVFKKKAKIILRSSYQHLFTSTWTVAKVFFLLPQKRLEQDIRKHGSYSPVLPTVCLCSRADVCHLLAQIQQVRTKDSSALNHLCPSLPLSEPLPVQGATANRAVSQLVLGVAVPLHRGSLAWQPDCPGEYSHPSAGLQMGKVLCGAEY